MEINEVLSAITAGQFDANLEAIESRIHDRQKQRATADFLQLKVGDKIRFVNIRPKFLIGLYGTLASPFVSGRKNMRAEIKVENTPYAQKYAGRTLQIPISCIQKVN